jgi:hypothetical protein
LRYILRVLERHVEGKTPNEALGLVPALTLWALRDARSPNRLVRTVGHWAEAMAELLRAPNGREALWTILRYIALVADDSVAATLAAAIPEAKPQVKEALMTLAEKWMADGEAKGKAEGKVEALRKLLTLKFGPVPEAASLRITGATETDVDRWLERVLSADSLDAVLTT